MGGVIDLEVWSDIACPWCYVGKRRLEAALAAFEHRDEVRLTWRSFELDPSAPAAREGSYAEHLARKYGRSVEEAEGMLAHMTEVAAREGLEFRFDLARMGSTFDAHRLLHLGAAHGRQDALKERLFRAYLTEGELLSDHATLTRLAGEVGVPAGEAADALASGRFAEEVRADEQLAGQFGLRAVPCFVADRARAATGAQDPDVLLDMLRVSWEQRSPLQVIAGGEACGPDGC